MKKPILRTLILAAAAALAYAGCTYDGTGHGGRSGGGGNDGDSTFVDDSTQFVDSTQFADSAKFVDSRDSTTYRKVTIRSQVWMAENLNYMGDDDNVIGRCYNDIPDSCAKYGRLYNWSTAMGGASSSTKVPSGVQGVCPVGWHLPSDAEWTTLTQFVGGAVGKLKSTSGWRAGGGNGTDDFGFSALPGGNLGTDNLFVLAGSNGRWWSATEYSATNAYFLDMSSEVRMRFVEKDRHLFSVRCVRD